MSSPSVPVRPLKSFREWVQKYWMSDLISSILIKQTINIGKGGY